jgi:hypothetical protein
LAEEIVFRTRTSWQAAPRLVKDWEPPIPGDKEMNDPQDPGNIPQTGLDPADRFKLHYTDLSDTVRHFSTIRSTLTVFLLTAGIAALGAHFEGKMLTHYTVLAAMIFFGMALFVCLVFSYRTEKYVLRIKALWRWSTDGLPRGEPYPEIGANTDDPCRIARNMAADVMNWALLVLLILIGIAGVCSSLARHA